MGLFLDLIHLPTGVTNDALEGIYKALSDGHSHDDDGIWLPHESKLLTRLVDLFTKRGLDRLDAVKTTLLAWQAGQMHKPSASPVAPPVGMVQHWTEAERTLAKLYLESLPPEQWTLDDHMLAVDLTVQTYLPPSELVAEAAWLVQRAAIMGRVQANLEAAATGAVADKILASAPLLLSQPVAPVQAAVMRFATARAAENVVALADNARHRLRAVIAQDLEQRAFAPSATAGPSLQSKLVDEFSTLNRDWRRIAITEAGEAQTQGFVASQKPGTKLKRVEQYRGACAFCRKIDGKVVTVVAADAAKKDPDNEVWPGKNNIGRSASPRKRVGDVLVEREPHERWWIPAGLAHPHCRGRWVLAVPELAPGDDPAFAEVLRRILNPSAGGGSAPE